MLNEINKVLTSQSGIITVTWLNHFSALKAIKCNISYSEFDFVGIDGWFLKRLLGLKIENTSADRLLPKILNGHKGEIALIGGAENTILRRKIYFEENFPNSKIILNINGESVKDILRELEKLEFERSCIFIVGLGAVLQDEFVLNLSSKFASHEIIPPIALLTCGGWMDQVLIPNYYPSYSYTLRLNWFFRFAREPRRLWRRYTIDAFSAIAHRKVLKELILKANIK